MKPSVFICYVVLALLQPRIALGQASFWFNNHNLPAVNAPVYDAQGIPLEGPNYLVELWGGSEPNSLAPAVAYYSGQPVILPFRTGTSAGVFRDSYANRDPADHPTILGVPAYVVLAWLEVRAWDARLGATYEEAATLGIGGYGESPLFSAYGSDPRDLLTVGAPLTGLQSFNLRPIVPEPSTWALLALGGTTLWWAARRRSRGRL